MAIGPKIIYFYEQPTNVAIGNDFDEVVCDHLSQIFATLCPNDIRPCNPSSKIAALMNTSVMLHLVRLSHVIYKAT